MEESSTKIHMEEDIHHNRNNILHPRITRAALDTVVLETPIKAYQIMSNQVVYMVQARVALLYQWVLTLIMGTTSLLSNHTEHPLDMVDNRDGNVKRLLHSLNENVMTFLVVTELVFI
jgi:hypothetical protein